MNVQVTKGNAFEIKPDAKYMLIIIPKEEWNQADKAHASERIQQLFPNVATTILNPGTKYKIVENNKVIIP